MQVGNVTLDMTVISGWPVDEDTCDRAIVLHIPHLCTLRYSHNVAEIAMGLACVARLSKGEHVTEDFLKTVMDAVADARSDSFGKLGLALVNTGEW